MRPDKPSRRVLSRKARAFATVLLLSGAAACTRPADLSYPAPAGASAASAIPLVAEVIVVDQRDVPLDYVGAVMGYDGKPLKRLQSPGPVADAVGTAFREALAARGELAPPEATPRQAPYVLTVVLLQLNAEQNADRQGAADMVVRLVDRGTGRVAYSARTYAESRGDNYLAYDNLLLGSPAALAAVARAVLAHTVNETVDRAGFRRAVRAVG